jgi:putative transcriptional regulator
MIKHHPKHELLNAFVAGNLPSSLSAAIAIHSGVCDGCQQNITALTQSHAHSAFSHVSLTPDTLAPDIDNLLSNESDLALLIDQITHCDEIDTVVAPEPKTITINNNHYTVPQAIQNIDLGHWQKMGKLTRAKLKLDEGALHTNLLHIAAGGGVPTHTHKGFELTLLLEGSFEDEMGTYHQGDFIWLDHNNTHNPISKNGCLCLTIADDALHFTQGFSKLLNPIGSFIY